MNIYDPIRINPHESTGQNLHVPREDDEVDPMALEENQLPVLNLALVFFRHRKELELNPESLCYRLRSDGC